MNRIFRSISLAPLLAFTLTACSSEKAQVLLFQPASDTVELGGSTTLHIVVSGSKARLTIDNGVGDVTRKTSVDVSPSVTTVYTLTAVDDGGTTTAQTTVNVIPARAAAFLVEAPGDAVAGQQVAVSVTALDKNGLAVPSFRGTAQLSSNDTGATLPASVSFGVTSLGKATVQATFKSAGDRVITATSGLARGVAPVAVHNAPAAKLAVSGMPAAVRAGDTVSVQVTALDAFGNRAIDYAGSVALSSTDAAATLAGATFSAADAGSRAFGVSFATTGSWPVTATDGPLSATTGTVSVRNAPASRITLAGLPAEAISGASFTVSLTLQDRFGNTALDYQGTVQLSSNDGGAGLVNPVFSVADAGVKSVAVVLATAGFQSVSARDSVSPAIAGSAVAKVKHGAPAGYVLSMLPSTAIAGDPQSLTITVVDGHANVDSDYTGSVAVTSNDATDRLPAAGPFVSGVRTVSLAFLSAAAHAVVVSEVSGSLTATSTTCNVASAAAARFAVSGPSTVAAGAPASLSVHAFDAYGNTASGYRGTVHFASTDPLASGPSDYTFLSGDAGVHTFSATLVTAGARSVSFGDGAVSGGAAIAVTPGSAARYSLSALPASAAAGTSLPLTVDALDTYGNVATGYLGSIAFTSSASASLPAKYAFTVADAGHHAFALSFSIAASSSVTVVDDGQVLAQVTSNAVAVGPAAPASVHVSGLPATAHVVDSVPGTLTVLDRFGNVATNYAGSLHVVLTDAAAPAVADVALGAGSGGTGNIVASFHTAGPQSIIATDTASNAITGSGALTVLPGSASGYALSPLPSLAVAGQPLPLLLSALDDFGNVDTSYAGTASFSDDPSDRLPAPTAFAAGRAQVSVAFTKIGTHLIHVAEVSGSLAKDTTAVTVTSDSARRLSLAAASSTATAGSGSNLTASALDEFGNLVATYGGTVTFTTTDAKIVPPAPVTFASPDGGIRPLSVTFQTSGTQGLSGLDASGVRGDASWSVGAANGVSCAITQVPASASAGDTLGARVTISDPYGNLATGYTGTIAITSSDANAQIPASAAYLASVDAGSRAFAARLVTAGNQSLTATDTANATLTCKAPVSISPAGAHFVVAMPPDFNAGFAAPATVTAYDGFGNAVLGFAGTVTFTSTDAKAALPANFVFTGAENGTTSVSVTFASLGTQLLTATSGPVNGSGSTQVHGLVYTNPRSGSASVSLVLNPVSTSTLVQLDLVATRSVKNGFAVGMNLPVDTTRATADATPLIEGNIFNSGTAGAKAVGIALRSTGPTANVLYSGVSQKMGGAGASTGDVAITENNVYYSIRLDLASSARPGAIFDGSAPLASFRAAVRDVLGNDTVAQTDFAIGRLEVR